MSYEMGEALEMTGDELEETQDRLSALLSACKQWRDATESRLRLLDSRGEAAKAMLPADQALCEALDRVES